jgi:hypothetical protein
MRAGPNCAGAVAKRNRRAQKPARLAACVPPPAAALALRLSAKGAARPKPKQNPKA